MSAAVPQMTHASFPEQAGSNWHSITSDLYLQDACGNAERQRAVSAVAHRGVEIEVVGIGGDAEASIGSLLGCAVGDEDLAILLLRGHAFQALR